MLEIICWIKQRYFASFFLSIIIISIILTMFGASDQVKLVINSIYLVIHLCVVMVYKNNECEELKEEKEFNHLMRYKKRINEISSSKQTHVHEHESNESNE